MRFHAVLFDAAETLFTTRGSVGAIYGSVAHQYGSKVPVDAIQDAFVRQFRGAGPLSIQDQKRWWKDVVYRVFDEVGMVDNFDRFFDQVYDKFRDSQGWVLFPETADVLQDLKNRGLKLGVISNFDDRIYSVMESLGIRQFFDAVTISSETGSCKPDPEIFKAAVAALKVRPSQTLMIGDSLHDDVEAGIRAGLEALLIDRRGRYAGYDHVRRVELLSEILPLLT